MGLCIARSLLDKGIQVTLIDPLPPGPGPRASSDHIRLIRTPYGHQVGYQRMVHEAFGAWDRLWAELGQVHYEQTGVLLIGDEEAAWVQASLNNLGPHEARLVEDPAGLVPGLELKRGQSAWLVEEAGLLFADEILIAVAASVQEVDFIQASVAGINADRGDVRLDTGETLHADRVIVSSGAWPWPDGSPRASRMPSRQTA
ncbi:MAG: FAD-dependent oxidoreductase, partial [Rhodothermales bacterium]|nr:FAD-dependent oxidoreductase [Rhodothermales bacterium]